MSSHGSASRTGVGRRNEDRAAAFLREAGYRVLERNFRCKQGELDVVAREGPTLVFVEVRSRASHRFGRASESVTPAKQRQIARVARAYLDARRPRVGSCRFDVVDITGDDIQLIRDAFRLGGHGV